MLQTPPPNPFYVTVVPEPSHGATIVDVVVASLGLAGALFVAAILLGVVIAVGLILGRRRRSPWAHDVPSITPMTPLARPSTRAR